MFIFDRQVRRQGAPRRYQLGFTPPVGLAISLASSLVEYLGSVLEQLDSSPLTDDLRQEYHFGEFCLDEERLGFVESGFARKGVTLGNSVVYETNLAFPSDPKVRWQKVRAVSATLKLIARWASDEEVQGAEGLEQLISISSICVGREQGDFALAASTSSAFRRWIEAKFNDELADQIKSALIALDNILRGLPADSQARLGFAVRRKPGRGFVIDIYGDGCNLYVPTKSFRDDEGWELETHNVDIPEQQLLFLVALGMICEAIDQT